MNGEQRGAASLGSSENVQHEIRIDHVRWAPSPTLPFVTWSIAGSAANRADPYSASDRVIVATRWRVMCTLDQNATAQEDFYQVATPQDD